MRSQPAIRGNNIQYLLGIERICLLVSSPRVWSGNNIQYLLGIESYKWLYHGVLGWVEITYNTY